ncbi:proton-conducting transporter membrane subunit [Agathobaculum sp. NTUH-O15-33]|uniref:complex I subunit 5 family protein n=1 Tax=Agathobaculum sp. NTUH-O15-33 TaxID=3079302 RepID=UPI0029588E21|nr:proton-conducting transporter membrane subunit [Agathobaculum sp. NTUH-O15-33]WNX86242.1 proton-conducting transporter membrane subunit [Agathobaculum sp. NTUH-O15-33]
MTLFQCLPAVSIFLCMIAAIFSSGLSGKNARRLSILLLSTVSVLSLLTLIYTLGTGESFVFRMGRFPAPWGNEIRGGILEAMLALLFSVIMLISVLGGMKHIDVEVDPKKLNLYFIMIDLMLASLLALTYTNDMFTAYVFVEINTIAAAGLIMIRQIGRTYVAAIRYLIMSQLGSGLFLLSLALLYSLTGQLLMSPAKEAVAGLLSSGAYGEPLIITIALMTAGLSIKSGLYPFHSWMPDAYGYSTAASSSILSGLVSKGYIVLLIKIYYRVIGLDIIMHGKISNILFVFGLAGMVMGSISAMRESDIRRMTAFSSVAQIGYVYMGLGLGTEYGVIASVFHILTHAVTKPLLFITATGLSDVSGGSKRFHDLRGAGYRNRIAGVGFTVGALSMVGLPLFAGFISKLLFAEAAVRDPSKMLPALIVLSISTILNAVYFLRTVINIYTPVSGRTKRISGSNPLFVFAVLSFTLINIGLGLLSQPVVDAISAGLNIFG